MRALPAEELLKGKAGIITHPVLDLMRLPASPYEMFVAGRQTDVPLLLGSNAEEGRSLVEDLDAVKAATYDFEITKHWEPVPPPLYDGYPHATDLEARQGRLDFERDLRFGWDMWAWARLQAQHGKQPIYYYHFARRPPFPVGSPYYGWGARHFAELWYMFDHLIQEPWAWPDIDRTLASDMASYWVNFARTGNPNGTDLPKWPEYRDTQQVLYLDDPIYAGPVADIASLRQFDAVYNQVRGAPFLDHKGIESRFTEERRWLGRMIVVGRRTRLSFRRPHEIENSARTRRLDGRLIATPPRFARTGVAAMTNLGISFQNDVISK